MFTLLQRSTPHICRFCSSHCSMAPVLGPSMAWRSCWPHVSLRCRCMHLYVAEARISPILLSAFGLCSADLSGIFLVHLSPNSTHFQLRHFCPGFCMFHMSLFSHAALALHDLLCHVRFRIFFSTLYNNDFELSTNYNAQCFRAARGATQDTTKGTANTI